ncbi:MAG TPA: hypothetical protein VFW89_10600 [Gemmatimonadaceae bacterium]|nr:hypothetical protein [Gemmatimonadaceae bacterium]
MAHGTVAVIRMPRLASVTRHGPLLSCVLVLALSAQPHGLRAQTSSTSAAATTSCLMSIPADSMVPVLVYVAADSMVAVAPDHRTSGAMANVSVLVQAVAEQVRGMLGARGDTLPAGSSALDWQSLDRPITVTAWRDGRMMSRPQQDTGDTKGSALLSRAFAAALAAGAGFVWPDSTLDSLKFNLSLMAPVVRRSHQLEPLLKPIQIPALTLAVPWEEPVLVRTTVQPKYPWSTESARATAKIFLQFVVDTLGHADPSSIHDIWYSSKPRLTGRLGEFYTEFVNAARTALVRWTFFPARVGGCLAATVVEQEFIYKEPASVAPASGIIVHFDPRK